MTSGPQNAPVVFIFSQSFSHAVRHVAGALFAYAHGPPPKERLHFLVADVQDFLYHAGFRTRLLFRVSLFVIYWLGPMMLGHLPFPWLTWRNRVNVIVRLERTIAGPAVLMVKTVLCLIYYEHPDALAELQGDTPCMDQNR